MKIVKKKIAKKQKSIKYNKNSIVKPKKKVEVVAQQFQFAKLLSDYDKIRGRVLKTLKKWLLRCFAENYDFQDDDFLRIWKGFFYAVWMSDKPLVQEDLCESISRILDLFPNDQLDNANKMIKAGFKMLALEWYGIDQHRIDKFMMLVRRYLRGSFRCLLRTEWNIESCKRYAEMFSLNDGILALNTPYYARHAFSLIFHIIDCYLEELSKISKGKIPDDSLVELLYPFIRHVCQGDSLEISMACRNMLTDLIKQGDIGLKYADATVAWRKMGCPAGGPDALEMVSDSEPDDENEEVDEGQRSQVLDPRAGRVDVVLEPLPVPARLVVDKFQKLMKNSSPQAYRRAKICLDRFEKLAQNNYPLKIKYAEIEKKLPKSAKKKAATELRKLETALIISSDELGLRGLKRKDRKRLLCDIKTHPTKITSKIAKVKNEKSDSEVRKRKYQDISKKTRKHTGDSQITDKNSIENKTANKKVNKKIQIDVNGVDNGDRASKRDPKFRAKSQSIKAPIPKPLKPINASTKDAQKSSVQKINKNAKMAAKDEKGSQKGIKLEFNQILVNKKRMVTPKKVKFSLKNNSMQGPQDYYKSVRQSPKVPFDGNYKPSKSNLKPSTSSPINPFLKKELRSRNV